MNKLWIASVLTALGTSVGCTHFQPIGPLAEMQGMPANPPLGATSKSVAQSAPEPIIREAPRPTPPAVYVTPGEVTNANAAEALKRLQQELDTDRRGMDAMPRYAEVSVVK
jgi:hypothetical protein